MLVGYDQTWILCTVVASHLYYYAVILFGLKLLFPTQSSNTEHGTVCIQQHSQRDVRAGCFCSEHIYRSSWKPVPLFTSHSSRQVPDPLITQDVFHHRRGTSTADKNSASPRLVWSVQLNVCIVWDLGKKREGSLTTIWDLDKYTDVGWALYILSVNTDTQHSVLVICKRQISKNLPKQIPQGMNEQQWETGSWTWQQSRNR